MDETFEMCIHTLEYVDRELAEEYKELVKTTMYDYYTLYLVYMANGRKATEIIKEGSYHGATSKALLFASEQIAEEEGRKQLKEFRSIVINRNEEKLHRKLRNGW